MANNQPTQYASGGANAQDGALPIRKCKNCPGGIVWATSNRTGKRYPVNISYGRSNQRFYVKTDFHKCGEVLAKIAEFEEGERLHAERRKREAFFLANYDAIVNAQYAATDARRAAKASGNEAEADRISEVEQDYEVLLAEFGQKEAEAAR